MPSIVFALLCLLGCTGEATKSYATATPEPPPKAPEVRITTDAILLGDESVVTLSGDRTLGVLAEHKRSGPNDLYIVPLHDALKRAQDQGRLPRQTPTSKAELVVIVDPATTYRVLFEVLFTAGQSEIGRYEIHEGERGGRSIGTEPPSPFKPPPLDSLGRLVGSASLNLSVILVPEGIGIKGAGGNVAPGCDGIGTGLALPKLATGYDLSGLTQCAKKLKASSPDFASETAVILTATPATAFREVVDVAIALRGSNTEPLFPTLYFGVAR